MDHTPVLIVGAGPTGLVLAAELHRRGTAFRIVEHHPGVLEATKAAALHARAIEHFRDLGVADRIVAEGHRVDVLELRTGYRDRVQVDFRTLGDTAYPHMVDIPQSRTEQVLIDHLDAAGVPIERGTTLTALEHTPQGVTATVTTPEGTTSRISAGWVVGADGVHSTVRNLAGLEFAGEDYADDWVLCDAEVDWPLPRNEMTFSADRDGIYGVFPLPGQRRYRLAYTQTRDHAGALVAPDRADAQQAMARTGIAGTVSSVDQFWTFNLAHRQATAFRQGRVFLAGDAGHVHTPFGGQGLNLGVGDAANLAWKLADVVAGRAPVTLLDTYHPERHGVARGVVALTHLGAQAMLLRGDPRRHLRDAAFAVLDHTPAARRQMARRLSQLAHSYRNTPAVAGRAGRWRGGDRLPDLSIFDGVTDHVLRLHDRTAGRGHTLLLIGSGEQTARAAAALPAAITNRWQLELDTLVITPDWQLAARLVDDPAVSADVLLDRGHDAATLYPTLPRARGPLAYLVRPDRHIGYVGSADLVRVERYLALVATARVDTATRLTGSPDAPRPDGGHDDAAQHPVPHLPAPHLPAPQPRGAADRRTTADRPTSASATPSRPATQPGARR